MEEQKPSGGGFSPGSAGDDSGKRDKPPHVIAEGEQLQDSRANGPVTRNRRSKAVHSRKDEMIIDSSTGTEGTLRSCSTPADTLNLEAKENNDRTNSGDSPHAEDHPEKVQENKEENLGSKRKQQGTKESNTKKRPSLPRRASKRIAGIEVGPLPELKPNNRTRRVSARRSNSGEAGSAADSDEFSEKTRNAANKAVNKMSELPQKHASISPEDDNAALRVETEKPGSPLNISFKDLWMDPCIEFAIKTLTGVIPIDEEDNAAVTEDTAGKGKNPVEDIKVGTETISPLPPPPEFSFKDVWEDPCIEFAIKTLTGAIPVGDDFVEQQQNLASSSEMLGNNSGSNVSSTVTDGNFNGSGGVVLQQFDRAAEAAYEHRGLVSSAASPYVDSGGLQRPGDGDMSKEVQRGTTCR